MVCIPGSVTTILHIDFGFGNNKYFFSHNMMMVTKKPFNGNVSEYWNISLTKWCKDFMATQTFSVRVPS